MKHTLLKTTAIAMALSVGVVQATEYKASTAEHPIKIVNLDALENQVKENMDKGALVIFVVVLKTKITCVLIQMHLIKIYYASCITRD
nr:hypothetical protein [Proteus mirabilis]